MADKLSLYNAALREIGEGRLASLTEARKPRYELDDAYDRVLADCLEAGEWNFAIRDVKLDSDTGITENFGYTQIFAKPSDWVRTVALSSNEFFQPPLTDHQYQDTVTNWETDITPIYVKYVSNGASYGLNLTNWPAAFTRYVEIALADRIVLAITQGQGDKERLLDELRKAKSNALSKDALGQGMKFRRASSWNASRGRGEDIGYRSSRRAW